FAIPDHPWVDAGEGAAVRIAMTVAEAGRREGRLFTVASEDKGTEEAEGRRVEFNMDRGTIFANLRTGADVAGAVALKANEGLGYRGMQLIGAGFIVTPAEARALGLGTVPGLERHIRHYRNGRDLTASPRNVMVIDLFGLTEAEVRSRFPAVYQHVLDNVKPERDQNNRDSYKRNWWIHGEPRKDMRPVLDGLPRYIATVETTKHRTCQFLGAETLPDNMLIAIGLDDAAQLAILSSRFHVVWALAAGGRLGYGNDPRYNKSRCFDPFPFPTPTEAQTARLRALGEDLDAHRKARQAEHPKLTLTGMYNVLEKLRAGERIEGKDREVYDQGLIGILRDLHDQIDTATAEAYGWPVTLTEDEILQNLVTLNRTRAAEEARRLVRWLRPNYQNPAGQAQAKGEQTELNIGTATPTAKTPWPARLPDQIAAVRATLQNMGEATPAEIARHFVRARTTSVQPLLESLTALGQARLIEGGRFAA
ncbi:type IIL restriction-modification enzyme MmeI, partial [Hoeflea sp.]|uniref:type IIL restriction-modification enzyme MmeI n=1 Tax=Hoeflea sp. TaxID=1940281 RepID=UPI0019BD9C0F|nr:class I SAM-dependent DNA methyltransferase [Hoeflea sp.]